MRAIILLFALGLAGCASTTDEPAPTPRNDDIVRSVDDRYLASIRDSNALGPMKNPSDSVIGLGHQVCDAFDRTSMTSADVTLIISDGYRTGQWVTDAGDIVQSAKTYYCPQHANR